MNRHRRAWGKCLVEQSLGSASPSRPYSSLFRPRSQLLVFSLLQKGRILAQDAIETARRASLEFVCVFGQDALGVLPPSSVGEMTLRLYGALSYSQNGARELRCALNGA